MANPTKKKSKYSKKDLKTLYPNKEELDNAWEYFHRLPENEKENFLNERRTKIEVQNRLKQNAMAHFPDGNLPGEIRSRIINISFLAPEEREKAAEEFLKEYPNQEDKTMTEENKFYNEQEKQEIVKEIELRKKARENLGITESGLSSGVDALEERLIKNWAADHNITLTYELKNAAREHLKSHSNLDEFMPDAAPEKQEQKKQGSEEKKASKKLMVSEQEIPADPAQPQQEPYDEQLQSIKEHWEKWCEETKDEQDQPLRNFKEIPNEDGFLKFEIEPTEALKAQNPEAKGAEVTYYSETEATMPMTDYAYFDEMAKAAKEVSQADVIECGNIKTPGYATRLIAAAYAHGMEVEMAPNKLDLSPEITKDIPDDVMMKVLDKQIFNRDSNAAEKVDYESIKEGLAAYKAVQERTKDENGNPKGEMTSLDISKMQFSDEAAKNKTIAAALEMGLKIEGVDKLKLNQETKEGIPEEAAKLLGTMQVGLLRAKVEKLHDPNTSEEEREALKTDKMKQFDAKDKKALIQQQIETLRNKDATKAEKDLAGVRLDTLQGKRWEQGYTNKRGGYE